MHECHVLNGLCHVRSMDGFLLEGQERSGVQLCFYYICLSFLDYMQLFARRGTIPPEQASEPSKWTTFAMPLREPGPAPTPFDFIRFLASSITFMAHLSEISVFFDGKRLARLCKDRGVPRSIELRPGLKRETPKSLMRVNGVDVMRKCLPWTYS